MKSLLKKYVIRGLSVLMAVSILLPQARDTMILPVSATVTQGQIDSLQDDADDLAAQQKELEGQMALIQADKSQALGQKNILEQQIALLQAEIDNITAQIAQYDLMIAQKEADIAVAEQEEADQYDLFCERVRIMEEGGQVSYWSILFSAADFSDLLDRYVMIEEIVAYDNSVMDDLIAMREALQVQHEDLESAKTAQEEAYVQQVAAQDTVKAREAEVDLVIADIKSQESVLQQAEAKLNAAAAQMDKEIARLEEELRQQMSNKNPIVSEGGFIWPLPASYNTLSSLFGGRIHPVTGIAGTHGGIDLPAPAWTEIYAAKSGVVLTSQYNSSYGYYCVIAHANGQSTLYAHQVRMPAVKVGDTVTQGQVIGYVGTTGSSTGNHLHYEIRENGVRKDPVAYYGDFTLYATYRGVKKLLNH